MFGTTAAVYGFPRIRRAISALSCSLLVLDTIEFFDDFSMIQPAKLAGSAESSFVTLLKLLGWQVADCAAKAKPFGKTFVTLGVQLDLNPCVEKRDILSKTSQVESKPSSGMARLG